MELMKKVTYLKILSNNIAKDCTNSQLESTFSWKEWQGRLFRYTGRKEILKSKAGDIEGHLSFVDSRFYLIGKFSLKFQLIL